MRFEHRLLNKQKIEKDYGFSGVRQLFSKEGYEVVRKNQLNEWKKSLFSHSVEEVVYLGSNSLKLKCSTLKRSFQETGLSGFSRVMELTT